MFESMIRTTRFIVSLGFFISIIRNRKQVLTGKTDKFNSRNKVFMAGMVATTIIALVSGTEGNIAMAVIVIVPMSVFIFVPGTKVVEWWIRDAQRKYEKYQSRVNKANQTEKIKEEEQS